MKWNKKKAELLFNEMLKTINEEGVSSPVSLNYMNELYPEEFPKEVINVYLGK